MFCFKEAKSTNAILKDDILIFGWKKKNVFFELPYCKENLIYHNLDVMYIEKNIFDNILRTLLDLNGKSKSNLKACHGIKDMGIRRALYLTILANDKVFLAPASFIMSKHNK